MSIYATLMHRKVDGVEIFVQGVLAHIDYDTPEWAFLGPVVSDKDSWLRTVFVVDDRAHKTGQRYDYWLLQLTPAEYEATTWPELRKRVKRALKDRP